MPVARLQKILADAGVASRRASERLILEGRVCINGRQATELGTQADPDRDQIEVDGMLIRIRAERVYLVLNKPRGYVTTASDELGRATVLDLVPAVPERIYPVGRLDIDSEGLLLLTNDGELTQRLTHPRHEVTKEYLARVHDVPDEADLQELRRGIVLDGRRAAPATVELIGAEEPPRAPPGSAWLRFILHEGRNRQVRRMCETVGLRVERLIRVRFGPIRLHSLRPGQVRRLTTSEIRTIRRAAGLPPEPGRASQATTWPD